MDDASPRSGGGPGGYDGGPGGADGGSGGAGGRRASGGRGGGNAIADKISMAGAKAMWSHEARGSLRPTSHAFARRSFPRRPGWARRNLARHGRAGRLFGR